MAGSGRCGFGERVAYRYRRHKAARFDVADQLFNIGQSPLVIADIHTGPAGRFGAILVRLCAECKSGQKGTKRLTKVATEILSSGETWVTVITGTFPNGVVRGQIKVR